MLTKRLGVGVAILAGLFLAGCQTPTTEVKNTSNSNTSVANTNKVDTKMVEEVQAMLAAHDKALNDQDVAGVMATFSTDPKTVLLGTGAGERFVGQEAIKNAYTEIVKDYDKGTFEPNCEWKEGGADEAGKMAWLAATCNAKDSKKGVKREYVLNVTGTVIKEPAGWRFISLHMSNAPGGAPPPDATKDDGKKAEAETSDDNKKPEAKK